MVNIDSYYISKNDTRRLKKKGEKERLTQIEQAYLVFLKKGDGDAHAKLLEKLEQQPRQKRLRHGCYLHFQ